MNDAAATRAYLRAAQSYVRSADAELAAGMAATEAEAGTIAGECPSALTFAPRDGAFGEIVEEAGDALFYAGIAPLRTARLAFARAVAKLRWSDRRLTRLVQGQAAEEEAGAAVGPPGVCAEIAAWKASAWAALPQSATAFLARVEALEAEGYVSASSEELREEAISRLLKRYESPGERRQEKRVQHDEQRRAKELSHVLAGARKKLAAALGVTAL